MKKYYNINYSLLVLLLTPTLLRNDLVRLFLLSMIKPLDDLQNDFFRFDESLQTKNNAQICYMQAVINDEFDFYERRIKIRNYEFDFNSLLILDKSNNQRVPYTEQFTTPPYIIMEKGVIGADQIDFEVVFPVGFTLSSDEQRRLKILIHKNKLSTKKYIISYE